MPEPLNIQTRMLQYSAQQGFLNSGDKVLAAVSGGIDSMAMLHLLHDAGVNTTVAHCNFCLRGEESDLDEVFVRTEAARLNVQCHVERFDTDTYAVQNGISIQMSARELRYRWFYELSVGESFDAIAIAHNRDDSIETMFINLARGTGIHGLSGIKPRNGIIIRPLLFASRNEIEEYVKMRGIVFREDSSNRTDKYARNYIRHHLIPELEQFFPGMRQSIERSMEHFHSVEMFYNDAIDRYKKKIVTSGDDLTYIDLQGLAQSPSSPALLYEILKPYGFSNTIASDIIEEHKHLSGRQFFSETHRIVYDRQKLILQKHDTEKPKTEYLIDKDTSHIFTPIEIVIEQFDRYPDYKPHTSQAIACLDGDRLQYPLILRKWEYGDRFCPLGMKSMKKLSDFFTDAKLSLIEKEKLWVLVSDGQIVWIAGVRIDDRFKITNETKRIVELKV